MSKRDANGVRHLSRWDDGEEFSSYRADTDLPMSNKDAAFWSMTVVAVLELVAIIYLLVTR